MNKLAVVGAIGLMTSGLFGQGLSTGGQNKDDWEEINFEFNSSILSDGYPSMLRLAELLSQHKDYRVKVTGHTDYVGSAAYNEKLALSRANAVKTFLVKYGVADNQIATSGDGKRAPEVDNKTKEGRFMNRRVVLTVTDGRGTLIKEGTIGDVLKTMGLEDILKKQQECCDQILKRLDKLDDILAGLKNLQGDNDKLRGELTDLRNQHNALRDQVAGLPKPLTSGQTTEIAHTEAMGALEEAQKRNKKFSVVGLNLGAPIGGGREGNFTFSGRGQFFSPFGGDGTHAVQAQGEYMYYHPDASDTGHSGRQEGQFDIGLVNRWGNVQAGAFGSFKYLNIGGMQQGGGLAQGAFLLDWIFSRGRVGVFGTKGFKNTAILNNLTLAPGAFLQTYARIVDQFGVNALVGTWGNAFIQGNLGYLRRFDPGHNSAPGGSLKLTQPINEHVAFTAEAGLNETLVNATNSGRLVVGLEVGNYIHPKDYTTIKSPVPMDVPRIRYNILTRRVGSSPPVANAGPNQVGLAPGTVTLDGSGSFDPLGLALTYSWTQIGGASVALSGANTVTATFTGAAGQTYIFKLTVTNTDGLSASATTSVNVGSPTAAQVVRFDANPTSIVAGQTSTLTWVVQGATSVTIQPGLGSVSLTGSSTVSPAQTTTYTLTAVGPAGTVNATTTVTVSGTGAGTPQIIRFDASPLTIQAGQQSTLSWATSGATTVSISGGVGAVTPNGSTTVSPTQTTTYILSASSADGKTVTAPVTVTVGSGGAVKITSFTSNPQTTNSGDPSVLSWTTENATQVVLIGGELGPQTMPVNGSFTVHPTTNSTYTLTAYGPGGQTVSVTISVFVR
jgi:hypothetical protein